MSTGLLRVFLAAVLIAGAGCAKSTASADSAPKAARVIPPRPINSRPLTFRAPARGLYATIEVDVSEDGRADVGSMRVIGNIAEVTRQDIRQWLASTEFAPATRGGIPERGVFKMQLRAR